MPRPDEEDVGEEAGRINISKEVIATIAGLAATEVPGVVSPKGGELPRSEAVRRLVETELQEGQVKVRIRIGVAYGHVIPEVVQELQEKIRVEVERMTALPVQSVDVEVTWLGLPKEEETKGQR